MSQPPSKRRRLRACNSCRQRKIRCDNLPGSCRNCETYGIKCEISQHEGVAARLSPPPTTSRRSYVNRQSTGRPKSTSGASGASIPSPEPQNDSLHKAVDLSVLPRKSDMLEGVVTTEVGMSPKHSKFAGMSSAHVFAKSAEELFKSRAPQINVMEFLCPAMSFAEEFNLPSPMILPMISLEAAEESMKRYWRTYGALFPILELNEFNNTLHEFYGKKEMDPARLACMLSVLALGTNDEPMQNPHFHTVLDIYPRLTARPYLATVQAFLLITLCWMNAGKDGQAILTLGTAIRIAQSIGLHRSLSTHRHPYEFNFVLKEHNLRSSLWWVCYCLDKKLSFEGGRPSAICDENCDADLPRNVPVTSPTNESSSNKSPFIFIHNLSGICQLLSTISSSLFHIRSSKMTEQDIVDRIASADAALINWAKDLPFELHPDQELAGVQDELARLAGSILHCIYFNALVVIHRASLISGKSPSFMENQQNPRVIASADICLMAARSLARSMNNLITEKRQIPSLRWIGQYPVNSAMALFIGTMKSPTKWSCTMDLALMNSLIHCYRKSEDKMAAERYKLLTNTLTHAVENATGSPDILPSKYGVSPAKSNASNESNDVTTDGQQREVSASNIMGSIPDETLVQQQDVFPEPDLENLQFSENFATGANLEDIGDQLNFGDFFGDYPSLWNMQLWPVSQMNEPFIDMRTERTNY